jgi:chondroitin AC lyase
MKYKIPVILLFQLFFFCAAQAQMDTILNRYRQYLFITNVPNEKEVINRVETLNPQGQWPDIDYNDKEPAKWKVSQHLKRLRDMAIVWANPKSLHFQDKLILKKINLALDHWLTHRYQSSNWWHNEIGVPQFMRDIIILLQKNLNPRRLKQSLEVMAQLRVHDDYTGGNLIWCADLGLHYGALTGDEALVGHCRKLIINEIKIGLGEGVQPDYSFHQHGSRLQMYQYGKAFLIESCRIAWQLRETPLAFPGGKIDILTDLILNGWQWMARGINTVPGTMDRSASRKGELKSPDIRALIPFLIQLEPKKAATFKNFRAIQNGKGALTGFRYYPYSDFAAFQRPGFSFFLKTISPRTLATESINHENLKGNLLNSGDAYVIRNGDEYFNLMPVWDWTALPGVTTFKDAGRIDRKDFVGSVSDSVVGFSVMDYDIKDKPGKQAVSARKFWACDHDVVISLIASLSAENVSGNVYTALDQCRWQGDVTVNRLKNILGTGSHKINNVKWIHHWGFAYIPLQPASFDIRLKEVSGRWNSINVSESDTMVKEKVFTPVMLHNLSAGNATGYVIALCKTPKETKRLAEKPTWKVIRNDKDCQSVLFNDGTIMVAFYSPSGLKISDQTNLKADKPCLILINKNNLFVSDPSHKGITVAVTFNDRPFNVALPKDGTTKRIEKTGNFESHGRK